MYASSYLIFGKTIQYYQGCVLELGLIWFINEVYRRA